MRIEDLMARPVRSCFASDSLEDACRRLAESERECLIVTESPEKGSMVGILTPSDVVRALALPARTEALKVSDAMSVPVVVCRRDDVLCELVELVEFHGVRHFPVVDERGQPIGILDTNDLARVAASDDGPVVALSPMALCRALGVAAAARTARAGH